MIEPLEVSADRERTRVVTLVLILESLSHGALLNIVASADDVWPPVVVDELRAVVERAAGLQAAIRRLSSTARHHLFEDSRVAQRARVACALLDAPLPEPGEPSARRSPSRRFR